MSEVIECPRCHSDNVEHFVNDDHIWHCHTCSKMWERGECMEFIEAKPNFGSTVTTQQARLAELIERRAKGYNDVSVPFSEEDEEEIDQLLDLLIEPVTVHPEPMEGFSL